MSFLTLLSLTLVGICNGELVIYPHANGPPASNHFSIYLSQGGNKHQSFTYIATSDHRVHESSAVKPHRSVSWTSFAFTGNPVTVEVHTQSDFKNCHVRPKSYRINCHRSAAKVAQFTITHNTKMMSVEFDNDQANAHKDITNKLLVFADPPETEVPSKHDTSVIFYDVGLHNLGGQKSLPSHIKEVYLAPGAYIQGGFITEGGSVKIRGRGIISGTMYKFKDSRFSMSMVELGKGSHHLIDGVTIVDPVQFYIRALSDHNTVRNVKMIAPWPYNSDGVATGHDGLIEDTFIWANDDSVKLYTDNMVVRRCVIWQGQNGAVFQTGWWTGRDMQRVRVSDIDVIHTDWCTFKGDNCHISGNDAVLDQAGDTRHFETSDITFENIRVEGSCPRIIYFKMHIGAKGTVSNVKFTNWNVESQPTHDSLHNEIAGTPSGGKVTNWQFTNFKIGGQCISTPHSADFIIDSHTTSAINFHCK